MEKPSTAKKKTFKPLILFDSNRPLSSKTSDNNTESQYEQALIEQHRLKVRNMLDYNAQMWENEGRLSETPISSPRRVSSSDQSPSQLTPPTAFLSSNSDINYPPYHDDRSNTSSGFFVVNAQASHNYVSIINDNNRRNSTLIEANRIPVASSGNISMLEPHTQTSIPLPLYSHQLSSRTADNFSAAQFISPSSSLLNEDHHQRDSNRFFIRNNEEEIEEETDYFETEEEESMTNTSSSFMTFGTTFINEPQFHHTYRPHISRKRRRGNLPKHVTEYLKRWLILHKKHPYPTEREKQNLADETGLMVNQISNWFINARRRILQPLIESENRQQRQSEAANQASSSSSAPPLSPTGVNVVGGSSNDGDDANRAHRTTNPGAESSSGDQYHPHQHHSYTKNSSTSSSSLLLQQPSEDDLDTEGDKKGQKYHTPPPPWVLLPAKLPSMNILEKDLDAFEPPEKE